MDVRAIILVGGFGEAAEQEHERFAGAALATQDVLGKPAVWRVVEQLKAQGINAITVVGEPETAAGFTKAPLNWLETPQEQFWRVAESTFCEAAQAGAEVVLVMRMGGYAEFVVDEFLQRHLDGHAHVTRACDANRAPLPMVMISASRRNDAAYLFRHRLQETRSPSANWVFRGYYNPLACGRDLRALAVDGLLQRCQLTPTGKQRRPGVWVAQGARIDRRARVLAPAFIGEHAVIRAAAVITRCSVVEHHAEVDSGTVIENATVLPFTYVGRAIDVAHAVAGSRRLLHLPRNLEIAIADRRLIDARSPHASLRALASVASLATFLPLQFCRGLFAPSHRKQTTEQSDAVKAPSGAMDTAAGFEASAEASSFPANLAVARRYGEQ